MTQYELTHKIYSANQDEISKRIGLTKFPVTFEILKNFSVKINDLLKGLERAEEDQNFYSSQCLSRVINEHFLVAYYIWTKRRVEQSDECAIDYKQVYGISEMIKQETFNSLLDKSFDKDKTQLQNFLVKIPEFNDPNDPLTEKNVADFHTKAHKFDVRRILKYMQDELDPNDQFKSLHILVLSVCQKYNKLSSYVHGGRMAELQTIENIPQTDKAVVMNDNTEFGKIFSYEVLSFIMLLLIDEDPSFMKIYQPIQDFINEELEKAR